MTNPEPLVTFVNYAYHNYPAGSYDLILWDHGGGPIVGYGHDENYTFSDPMKVPELAEALAGTDLVKSGGRFDMIGFDACLMGSMEVAKAFSGFSDYLVASEEVEPGRGWNYDFLSDLGNGRVNNTEELGRSIIDHYVDFYVNNDYDVDLTLSLVDLRKVNRVIDAVDGLFAVVKDDITRESFSQYSRLMTRDKVYGYAGRDDKSYDLVDLMDLCGSLRDYFGDEVARVEEGLKDFVIYSKSNLENANGSSVYFLNYNRTGAEEMLAMYRDVAFSNGYYDFLTKYKDFVTGSRMVSKAVYKDLNEEKTESGIELELTDELKDNYQSGEIIIYRKLDENKYMPVYRSSEVKLEGNKLKATTYDLQFVIEVVEPDGGVEYGWSSMMEKERNESYADYVTSGVLWYEDGSEYGIVPKNYEMYIRVPKGSTEAQIRDIRVSSDDGLSSKMSFDQKKIDIVEFTIGAYKLYNEAGELDYNMESYGSLYGTSVNLGDGDKYRIRLVGLDFDFGDMYDGEFSNLADYYAEFIVHDTQGDAHRLNLVHI